MIDKRSEATWDRRVAAWANVCGTPVFRGFRDVLLSEAGLRPNDVVLDLGCGTGLVSLAAAPCCRRVVGVDISTQMLDSLSAQAESLHLTNVDVIHADMRCVPLPDHSVDVVVSCYAFHHLSDEGKELAIADVRRILRPGGRLAVVDMMFALSLRSRDRQLITNKVVSLARKGPGGVVRIAKNAGRLAFGRWEAPAPVAWWVEMLERRGFEAIMGRSLQHEAGYVTARKP